MYARVSQGFDDFDAARAELYRGLLFWGFLDKVYSGVPDSSKFVAANLYGSNPNKPKQSIDGPRFSVWELNPSTFYLVTTNDSGKIATSLHSSSAEAMNAAQNRDLYP